MEAQMKWFKGFKNLEDLKSACNKRGWELNHAKYDEGSDHVSFRFEVGDTKGICLVSLFNGRFFGTIDHDVMFDSNNTDHEDREWFQVLLETVYK